VHGAHAGHGGALQVLAVRAGVLLDGDEGAAGGLLGDHLVHGRGGLGRGLGALGADLHVALGALADVQGLVVDNACAVVRVGSGWTFVGE